MCIKKIAATLMVVAVIAIAAYWLRDNKEGFAVLFVGIITVAIAYRQWKTEQNKLKLDLFDRRYRIYEATRKLLTTISQGKKACNMESCIVFWSGTSGAEFLFDSEVESYLKEVADAAMRLIEIGEDDNNPEQKIEHNKENLKLVRWAQDQLHKGDLTQQFKPYLAFSKLL